MIEYIVLGVVAVFIVFFLAIFAWRFLVPSRRLGTKLDLAIAGLRDRQQEARAQGHEVVDLDGIEAAFRETAPELRHLWKEFRDTLHREQSLTDLDESGQPRVARFRQTAPAELYFSTRAVVDVPLRTDFFKHLPGILTGIGIIGTFSGLIAGLAQFGFSGTPDEVGDSVDTLVEAVRNAFIVSAFAIGSAMAITAYEKVTVARRYSQVQDLQQAIDEMFDAGAGEDYLSTIASKSAESATDMAQLRQGLIDGFAPMLKDLSEQQTAAISAASQQQNRAFGELAERQERAIADAADRQEAAAAASAEAMASAVSATFEAPLTSMTRAIEKSQEDQAQSVQRLLDASLETFATRLDELVGAKLTGAAGHIESAADRMSDAMREAPEQLEQSVARVGAKLEEIGDGAEASVERMATATEEAAEGIRRVLADMSASTSTAAAEMRSVLEDMGASTNEAATQIREVLAQVAASAEPMAEHTTRMADAAAALADSVAQSAETWDYAIERLKSVNAGLDDSVDAARGLTDVLGDAATQTAAGASAFEESTVRLERVAGTISTTADALRETLAAHETDRASYGELADTVSRAAEQLRSAQDGVDSFLAGVADALAETSAAFGRQLNDTLAATHNEFHQNLASATKTIGGAVQDMDQFLTQDFVESVDRLRAEMNRLAPGPSTNGS